MNNALNFNNKSLSMQQKKTYTDSEKDEQISIYILF